MHRYGSESLSDFYAAVEQGTVPGHGLLGSIGTQDNVGTSYQDIWSGGGNLVYPTTAETLEVVFADANDTAAGTGAQSLLLTTYDINCVPQAPVVIATNGGTQTITGTHFDVIDLTVIGVGTVRGAAIGDITLQVSGGGAVRGVIKAGTTSMLSTHVTVPADKVYYWKQASIFPQKGEDVNILAHFQIGGEGPFFRSAPSSTYQQDIVYPFIASLKLPPRSRIFQQAKSTNPNTLVTSIMEFTTVDTSVVPATIIDPSVMIF